MPCSTCEMPSLLLAISWQLDSQFSTRYIPSARFAAFRLPILPPIFSVPCLLYPASQILSFPLVLPRQPDSQFPACLTPPARFFVSRPLHPAGQNPSLLLALSHRPDSKSSHLLYRAIEILTFPPALSRQQDLQFPVPCILPTRLLSSEYNWSETVND